MNLDIGEGHGNQGEKPMYIDPTNNLLKTLHSFVDNISIRYVADIELFDHDISQWYTARLVCNGSLECFEPSLAFKGFLSFPLLFCSSTALDC